MVNVAKYLESDTEQNPSISICHLGRDPTCQSPDSTQQVSLLN